MSNYSLDKIRALHSELPRKYLRFDARHERKTSEDLVNIFVQSCEAFLQKDKIFANVIYQVFENDGDKIIPK